MENRHILRQRQGTLSEEALTRLLRALPLKCWLLPRDQKVRHEVRDDDQRRVKPVLVDLVGPQVRIMPPPGWRISCVATEPGRHKLELHVLFCEAHEGSVLATFIVEPRTFGIDHAGRIMLEVYKYHTGESPHLA